VGEGAAGSASGDALKKFSLSCCLILLIGLIGSFRSIQALPPAQTPSKLSLDYVLNMMDHAAEDFKSLTAAVEYTKYTAVVKDTSTESGEIFVRKDAKIRIDFQTPDPRTIIRNGDNLYIYTPKINRVEEYNIGKNAGLVDQYVALGFGTRAQTMRKNYDVALSGEEDIDGRKTAVIELTPHSEEQRKQITKVVMWIDESSWLPVQEKFLEATPGDYATSRFTKAMKNLKLGDGKFKPDWPKGTKIEKHS
jgi:outer membrane lipoprotein-sorting protein